MNNPVSLTDPDGKCPICIAVDVAVDLLTDGSGLDPEAKPDLTKPRFGGTVTRYMGAGEADWARRNGYIPNTDAEGKERPTHVTTDEPVDKAKTAKKKYELPVEPTHRATVPQDRVPGGLQPTPDGRPRTSGGGSQSAATRPIPVKKSEIVPLKQSVWKRMLSLDLVMNVPMKITVQVVSDEEAELSGIIVKMVVTTGQKNPYFIFFPKTDTTGTATLTRKDFIGQFKDHWESALMDHAGTPASADSRVQVSLYDPSWAIANKQLALAWPLLKHERTKWFSREEEYESRVSSRSADFAATPITVDLHQTHTIVLPISRRVSSSKN